ncbi:MAG TPA: ABC transporter permease [Spirochaetales bacterium]|nr:ABC transporter permease [Spirochaetales bacterium]
MRAFALFYKNFMIGAFRNKLAFLVYFAAPIASFVAMFFLLRLTGDESFAAAQAIGLVVYFSMLQATMITSLTIRDREEGAALRIAASPTGGLAYAIGNGAAAFTVLCAQVILFVGFIAFVFPVDLGLGAERLLAILLAFNVASVGLALLLCELSDSSSGAMLLANLVILATSLLGGVFFPAEFMGASARRMAAAFPQYWAMQAIDQARSGAAHAERALSTLILLLFGALFIVGRAALSRRRRSV